MERANGGSLYDHMNDGTDSYSLEEKYTMASQMVGGLRYLHDNGIVHGDIKPGNILLHGRNALIGDFGKARDLKNPMHEISYGSPRCLSPLAAYHRLNGEEADQYDPMANEVWSCGIVLYYLFAGCLPYNKIFEQELNSDQCYSCAATLLHTTDSKFPMPTWNLKESQDEVGRWWTDKSSGLQASLEGINRGMAALICRMLDPNEKTRITMRAVEEEMRKILQPASSSSSTS